MKKGLTELVMILDRSGSMSGLEADTEVIYDRVDICRVEPMTDRQYYVRGCTALLDAVGDAIHHVGNIHKYARKEDVPEKTIFVITTDGMENASRRYNYNKVRRMIERQKEKYNWEFIFLGANIDAAAEASRLGIDASRAARYECDSAGTALNYSVVGDAVAKLRKCATMEMSAVFEEEDALAPIRENYRKKNRKK